MYCTRDTYEKIYEISLYQIRMFIQQAQSTRDLDRSFKNDKTFRNQAASVRFHQNLKNPNYSIFWLSRTVFLQSCGVPLDVVTCKLLPIIRFLLRDSELSNLYKFPYSIRNFRYKNIRHTTLALYAYMLYAKKY